MAGLQGFLGAAAGVDPTAYQTGTANQLAHMQNLRVEQERKNQLKYGGLDQQENLTYNPASSSMFKGTQLEQYDSPVREIKPPVEEKKAGVDTGTTEYVVPDDRGMIKEVTPTYTLPEEAKPDGTVKGDIARFTKPEGYVDLQAGFAESFQKFEDYGDPESAMLASGENADIYLAQKFEKQALEAAKAGLIKDAEKLWNKAQNIRKDFDPYERIKETIEDANDAWTTTGGQQLMQKARDMYAYLMSVNTPEAKAIAAKIASEYRAELGLNQDQIPVQLVPPRPKGVAGAAWDKKYKKTHNPKSGFPLDIDKAVTATDVQEKVKTAVETSKDKTAGLDTSAQSSNTGNIAVGTEKAGTLEEKGTVAKDQGEIIPLVPGTSENTAPGKVNSPPVYLKAPQKITQDIQIAENNTKEAMQYLQNINARINQLQRQAQISRISGNLDTYNSYMTQARDLSEKSRVAKQGVDKMNASRLYLQGMQGLSDLEYGNNGARLSAIWSAYSGYDVRIVPRSDGNFDVDINGQTVYSNLTKAKLSEKAQLVFDSNYRATIQKITGERNQMLWEVNNIDAAKERLTMLKEINVAWAKAKADAWLKEQTKDVDFSFKALGDGSGKGLFMKNGQYYLFNPMMEFVTPEGDKEYKPGTQALTFVEAASMLGSNGNSNAYKEAIK